MTPSRGIVDLVQIGQFKMLALDVDARILAAQVLVLPSTRRASRAVRLEPPPASQLISCVIWSASLSCLPALRTG